MSQAFPPYNLNSATAQIGATSPVAAAQSHVLVFLKGLATPVVLYADNSPQVYEEIRQVIKQADLKAPKLIERQGVGPLKKVSFLDIELTGVALQADLMLGGLNGIR